jgi:Methyltransferase domain
MPVSWQASARQLAQHVGLEPRYLRRLRWLTKARSVRSVGAPLRPNLAFVLADPEPANFTYALDNERELAAWVAEVVSTDLATVERLFAEAHADPELGARLTRATAGHWWWTKSAPPFGKRLAWYALTRLLAPELVIETGVHDGLGSLILLRALELNAHRGSPGALVSFDINPTSGWLVGSHPMWELRIEATRPGLADVLSERPALGLFIHDSLHTYENERYELSTAVAHLAPGGLLISDNAHGTRALADTCAEFGLRYSEFAEQPRDHFYPGGMLGAGLRSG